MVCDYRSRIWTDNDRRCFDIATQKLVRTPIGDRRPRGTTGQVFVWKEGYVVVVSKTETLDNVFKKLIVENFLSAPVIDDTESLQYCGVISMYDIVVYVTTILFDEDTPISSIDFFSRSSKFCETKVQDIMAHKRTTGLNKESPIDVYRTLIDGYSLLHALETLARTGCHRVPIVNSKNRVVGIYTESMAISDIRQQLNIFGNIVKLKVSDMKQSECLFLIKNTDSAIDAFRKISETNVSGLPVVDSDGALCDSISVRDLRAVGMNGENFSRLFLTVQEFKSISRQEYPHVAPASHWTTQPVPKSARYVTPDDDFEVVIRSMNDGNMHRIFVCSQMSIDTNKPIPISVISQRDIIYTVLRVLGTISD